MANLEKKRLEKQEAAMASQDFELPEAPPEPKQARKPRAKKTVIPPEPEVVLHPVTVIDSEPVPVPSKVEPESSEPESKTVEAAPNTAPFDEDAFVEKVAAKIKDSLSMPPPPPKLITRRRKTAPIKPVHVPDQEDAIPPYNNFSWL